MVRGLEELRLIELAPEDDVLAEVNGLVTQGHRLDALAHAIPVEASRVEQRVASRDLPVPPLGQARQLREILLPRQERHANREGVVALQQGFNALSDLVTRGVRLEEKVAAVDVGANVPVACVGDLLAQLTHDDLVLAPDVNAAQQRHVLHAVLPVFLSRRPQPDQRTVSKGTLAVPGMHPHRRRRGRVLWLSPGRQRATQGCAARLRVTSHEVPGTAVSTQAVLHC